MNRPIRKLLAWTLALIMLIGMMPVDAVAAIIKTDTSNAVKIGNIVPMRIISPVEATHTYEFQVPNAEGTGFEIWGTQIVKNSEKLIEPAAPELTNKKFIGWSAQDEFGNSVPINFGVPITVAQGDSKTIIVTAQFEDVVYVRFINTDGDKVIVTRELAPGATTNADNIPLIPPDGKALSYWSTTKTNPAPFDFSTSINSNTDLYAVFVTQHVVTFNSHGGSAVSPAYVNDGETVAAPNPPPTRNGYNFAHWSTTENGAAYNFGTSVSGNMTLHAVWTSRTDVKYRVIHWQQNAEDDNYVVESYEDKTGTAGAIANYTQKTYTGFHFHQADSKTINGNGTTVVNVYYNRNVYTFTIERRTQGTWGTWETVSTAQYKYGQSTAPTYNDAAAVYPKYNWFITRTSDTSYSEAPAMPNNNLTVHGRYAGEYSFVIHYVEKGTTTTIKDDYTFYGPRSLTFTEEDGIDIPGFTVRPITEWVPLGNDRDGTIYYDRNKYNFSFVENGGSPVSDFLNIPFDKPLTEQPNPVVLPYTVGVTTKTESGVTYTFAGWYDNAAFGGNPYDLTGKKMPAHLVTLYAKWNLPSHEVTYNITADGSEHGSLSVTHGELINESEASITPVKHPLIKPCWSKNRA